MTLDSGHQLIPEQTWG